MQHLTVNSSTDKPLLLCFLITALLFVPTAPAAAQEAAPSAPTNLRLLNHPFTGLPMTSDGWTDLTALVQTNSRIVYVSASGNDATAKNYDYDDVPDPFNPTTPNAYATLDAAYAQMRNNYPDIMLLRRGDTWATNFPNWAKSGESQAKRMFVSAYGPLSIPRPKTGRLNIVSNASYLIFSSLELDENERSINIEKAIHHVLFEDILSPPSIADSGIVIQNIAGDGGVDYLAIRRSSVIGRWRPDNIGYKQGIYIDDSINLLIEQCIFDENGWENGGGESSEDIKAHNTYIMLGRTGNENHIFRYNISTRGRASGIQAGSGGLIYGNLSVQDGIGITIAREDAWWPDGFGGLVKYNVVLHGRDVNSFDRRGFGISISNIYNMTIEENIIAGNTDSGQPYAIRVHANPRSGVMMYVRYLTIKDNIIHNWNGNNIIDGDAIALFSAPYYSTVTYSHGSDPTDYITGISILGNRIHSTNPDLRVINCSDSSDIVVSSDNTFFNPRPEAEWFRLNELKYDLSGYQTVVADMTSSVDQTTPTGGYGIIDYLTSIGETATLESFYSRIRAQRRGNWDSRYTAIPIINFVREKFGREPLPQIDYPID